jgi:hypothetical protein
VGAPAAAKYGYRLGYIWLPPRLHTVTASSTYGCSLRYTRLQVRELREPAHFNVALDMHLYAAFDGFTRTSPDGYLVAAADAMDCKLRAHAYHHPILVGEWALSSGGRAPIQDFVDGQFEAFEHALGWCSCTLEQHYPG